MSWPRFNLTLRQFWGLFLLFLFSFSLPLTVYLVSQKQDLLKRAEEPQTLAVACDGNNDQDKINTAINALPQRTVTLPGRQCNLSGPIIPIANTVLEGQGTTTKLFKAANFNPPNHMIVNSNVGGKVTIRKMEIDGNKYQATEEKSAIELGNAPDSLFEDLYIHDVRYHGIALRSGSNNSIARRIQTEDIGTMVINDDGTGQGRGTFRVGETASGSAYNLRAVVTSVVDGYRTITIKGLTTPIGAGMILTGQSSGARLKIQKIPGRPGNDIRGNGGGPFVVTDSSGVEISDSRFINQDRGILYRKSPYGRIIRITIQNVYSQACIGVLDVGQSDNLRLDSPQVTNCTQHNGIQLEVSNSRIISSRVNGAFLGGLAVRGSYNVITDPQATNYGNNGVDDGVVLEYHNANGTAVASRYNTVTGGLSDGRNDRPSRQPDFVNGHSGVVETSGIELVGTPNRDFQIGELVIGETSGAKAGFQFRSTNGIVVSRYSKDTYGAGKVKYIKGNFRVGEVVAAAPPPAGSGARMTITGINHLVDNNIITNVRSINHNTELGPNYVSVGPHSFLDVVLNCDGRSNCWDSVTKQQGTAVIRAGTRTVTVSHNLRYPPQIITLNAKDAAVTNKTWNNFIITLAANAAADRQITWYAERSQTPGTTPTPTPTPTPTRTPTPPPGLVGDIDQDGDVDIFDYNILVSHFGPRMPPGSPADLDHDGDVDIFDYNLLISNFGRSL